jgi:Leucine-rich repeat (LRR) protein
VRTDSFPDEVTKLTNLSVLDLFMTNISGIIPARISNLVNLVHLDLSNNYLTGVIPPEIDHEAHQAAVPRPIQKFPPWPPPRWVRQPMKLQYFHASENNLTGNLSEVRSLTQLVSLYLSFNNISGEVPLKFGEFKELVTLGLAGNNLTGELPQSLES